MSSDEQTPLLWAQSNELGDNPHDQFCALVGIPPSISNFNLSSKDVKQAAIKHQIYKNSLYGRATTQLTSQRRAYNFSASLNNTLLLSQVILGAVLTGLGAAITNLPTSTSGPILVTVFGAMNTIIAGLVAYLKSRGQPMRARMYRDDLERVVDEIENSEVMWRGIAGGVHGYDDIDTESQVTVRSEVARLTRLYERAVRNNTVNNPDMYMSGGGSDGAATGLRNRALPNQPVGITLPAAVPAAASGTVTGGGEASAAPAAPAVPVAADPDQSPASAPLPPKDPPKKDEDSTAKKEEPSPDAAKGDANKEDKGKAAESSGSGSGPASTPAPAPAPPNLMDDPDASPASAAVLHRHTSKDDGPKKVKGDDD